MWSIADGFVHHVQVLLDAAEATDATDATEKV